MEFMRFHSQPTAQLPSDLADIIDFFIALTICNTVVVSSPNQPRQKVKAPQLNLSSETLHKLMTLYGRLAAGWYFLDLVTLTRAPMLTGADSGLTLVP